MAKVMGYFVLCCQCSPPTLRRDYLLKQSVTKTDNSILIKDHKV